MICGSNNKKLLVGLVLGSLSFFAHESSSRADSSSTKDSPSIAEARAAFVEGMQLLKAGSWSEAQSRFELALASRRTPGLFYYVAFCLENQGSFLQALQQYRKAEQLLEEIPAGDVAALVPDAIARVERAVATISFRALPKQVQVEVDGKTAHDLETLRLNPGPHHLSVESPKHEKYEFDFVLAPGEVRTLRPQLVVKKKTVPATSVSSSSSLHKGSAAPAKSEGLSPFGKPLAVGGAALVSVAGLATGIYFTVASANSSQRVRDLQDEIDRVGGGTNYSCSDASATLIGPCTALADELSSRRSSRVWTAVGYSVFGVGAVAAVVTQALWRTSQVEVAIAPGGGQLGWSGRF